MGWNYENLMTSYSSTINYLYDSLGKRVWKQNNTNYTRYFFDGINPLMEKGSSNNSTFTTSAIYTLAPGVIKEIVSVHQNGTDYFYHYDPIGNVLFISDTSGNINTSYVQEGFGNVIATNGSPNNYFHLTTKEQDPYCGLYYFNARWYDPSVGRFISKDPIGIRGGINLYCYALNNPLTRIDPLGYTSLRGACKDACLLALGVGAAAVGIYLLPEELGSGMYAAIGSACSVTITPKGQQLINATIGAVISLFGLGDSFCNALCNHIPDPPPYTGPLYPSHPGACPINNVPSGPNLPTYSCGRTW